MKIESTGARGSHLDNSIVYTVTISVTESEHARFSRRIGSECDLDMEYDWRDD